MGRPRAYHHNDAHTGAIHSALDSAAIENALQHPHEDHALHKGHHAQHYKHHHSGIEAAARDDIEGSSSDEAAGETGKANLSPSRNTTLKSSGTTPKAAAPAKPLASEEPVAHESHSVRGGFEGMSPKPSNQLFKTVQKEHVPASSGEYPTSSKAELNAAGAPRVGAPASRFGAVGSFVGTALLNAVFWAAYVAVVCWRSIARVAGPQIGAAAQRVGDTAAVRKIAANATVKKLTSTGEGCPLRAIGFLNPVVDAAAAGAKAAPMGAPTAAPRDATKATPAPKNALNASPKATAAERKQQ